LNKNQESNYFNNKLFLSTLDSSILKNAYSTSTYSKNYISTFGTLTIPLSNITINTHSFSVYNKRFMNSIRQLNDNGNNNFEQFHKNIISIQTNNCLNQFMTYSTENEHQEIPISEEQPNNSQKQDNSEKGEKEGEGKENVNFATLIKKYGIIAIAVYFVLTCTIYFTTLGIILYYDIDPDELTKKSKTYVTNLTKRILGRVETIEESIEEVKNKKHRKNKSKKQEQQQQVSETGEELDENGNPIDKKKKLIKTMIMTYAVSQIFSPPKTMLTLIITPYVAKILKRGF